MSRVVLAVAVLALSGAPAQATTATARHTDDPTTIELRVKLDITVKRPLERKVFAEACGLPILVCDGRQLSKRVRLHRGRNRQTVKLMVQRSVYSFVGTDVTGTPWDGYRMVSAPVDTVFWSFGRDTRMFEVRPLPVAHDTLVDGSAP